LALIGLSPNKWVLMSIVQSSKHSRRNMVMLKSHLQKEVSGRACTVGSKSAGMEPMRGVPNLHQNRSDCCTSLALSGTTTAKQKTVVVLMVQSRKSAKFVLGRSVAKSCKPSKRSMVTSKFQPRESTRVCTCGSAQPKNARMVPPSILHS